MAMDARRHKQNSAAYPAVLAFGAAASSLVACTTWPAPPATTVDCTVETAYDFRVVEDYSTVASWFSYGDLTPGAVHSQTVNAATGSLPTFPIEGDGVCGNTRALVLATAGHNDYGSGFGSYCLANNYADNGLGSYPCTPQDASGYEGFSFWARNLPLPLARVPGEVTTNVILDGGIPESSIAPDGSLIQPDGGKLVYSPFYEAGVLSVSTPQGPFNPTTISPGVTVFFDDKHSSTLALTFNMNRGTKPEILDTCILPPMQRTCTTTVDTMGNTTTAGSGCVPAPNQCGNSFTRTLQLTEQWQLYLLPFRSFNQDAFPNRAAEDVDPATIFTFGMRFPKEAVAEVWLSKLSFYRKKQLNTDAGGQ